MIFSGFQCDKFQRIMTSTEALTDYKITQCSEDQDRCFKCNLCPYSTNVKYNLKRHFLVHSGERPYKCDVCNQCFTQVHALKSHMLLHTGEKPYSCNVCSMSFRQLTHLKLHMRKHL